MNKTVRKKMPEEASRELFEVGFLIGNRFAKQFWEDWTFLELIDSFRCGFTQAVLIHYRNNYSAAGRCMDTNPRKLRLWFKFQRKEGKQNDY